MTTWRSIARYIAAGLAILWVLDAHGHGVALAAIWLVLYAEYYADKPSRVTPVMTDG